jgi:hypothetical protein
MKRLHLSDEAHGTLGRFLFEIATIIVGVLIALSVDGVSESLHDRKLVREARANLQAELRDNRQELATVLAKHEPRRSQVEHAIALADQLLADGEKVRQEDVTLGLSLADLSTSARETAAATGAFGKMTYAEVKHFTSVYGMQEKFQAVQDRMSQQFVLVLPVTKGRLATLSTGELQAWHQNLRLLLQHLVVTTQFGTQLLRAYDDALAAGGSRR